MSLEEIPYVLSAAYDRACYTASPEDLPGIRRAFRRAMRAAGDGDTRPAILLTYRYP